MVQKKQQQPAPQAACGETVYVSLADSGRRLKAQVRRAGSWFVRFRRWAKREDLRYTALGNGEWITLDELGSTPRERRRRMKELKE